MVRECRGSGSTTRRRRRRSGALGDQDYGDAMERVGAAMPAWAKRRRLAASLAAAGALTLVGCAGETFAPTPGDPEKPARACPAVDEATPLSMSADDRLACEATMRAWYGETWYSRPDPADHHEGEAQLEYLRAKALGCRSAADAYGITGRDRWMVLMRCLVIVRTR